MSGFPGFFWAQVKTGGNVVNTVLKTFNQQNRMRNMCVAYDEDQEDQTHSGKSMHSGAQRPAQCANAD